MQTQPEFLTLRQHLEQTIVGQTALIDRLMIGMLTSGHILLESAPGLAKTTAVKALASGIHASFQRIQFTPDLLPADITGGEIFDPGSSDFRFVQGPLFHEIILADEINRAPPKVQSALLEAMEEHQVTIGGKSYPLPDLFIVMATQNPLEQGGTYPLPEAQLDRFLLHVVVDYPDADEELQILERDRQRHFSDEAPRLDTRLDPKTVLRARQEVAEVHIEPALQKYVVEIVQATRNPVRYSEALKDTIQFGASPRATLAMVRAASAHAYLQGREYVLPDDILEIAGDVLRHRMIPSYHARARNLDTQDLIRQLLDLVPVP